MELCRRCIMPAGSVGAALDEDGICRYCKEHQPITYHGEEALIRILDSVRGQANRYDCMVNISGGRDSAYTLLAMVRDYGMKVLAVNYANPFTDPQARKNIENMVRILGIDFVQFKLKNNIHERALKNNILAWFKHPTPAMVPAICIGCKIIWPSMLKIARRHRIRCIVNGGNPYEYTSFKKALLGVSQDADLKVTYLKNIRGLMSEALKNVSYLKPDLLPTTIKGFLFSNPYAPGSRILGGNIKYIDFFHYVPWDEQTVLARIQAELDWDYPRNLHSTWRFDCQIAHLKDYMYLQILGATEKDDFYSRMIREGQMPREEALQRIEAENRVHWDVIADLFAKLGLDAPHFENVMQSAEEADPLY